MSKKIINTTEELSSLYNNISALIERTKEKVYHIEDRLKREFYATLCSSERWSVRTLRERKSSMMYERTVISKKPELTIINDLKQLREENKMSPDLFFKDPYVLDFLGLEDTYSEKDLENAILTELL